MPSVLIYLALGSLLAAVSSSLGRPAIVLSVTTGYTGILAFFFMPPIFSFLVSRPIDLITLIASGLIGLVIAHTARKPGSALVVNAWRAPLPRGAQRVGASIEGALAPVLGSNTGVLLRAAGIELYATPGATIAAPLSDLSQMFTDVFRIAVQSLEVRRILVFTGRRPGLAHVCVVVQSKRDFPRRRVINIGKSAAECEPLLMPNWPPHIQGTWFDNGFARIYQISIRC